jgi:hypothetical protein
MEKRTTDSPLSSDRRQGEYSKKNTVESLLSVEIPDNPPMPVIIAEAANDADTTLKEVLESTKIEPGEDLIKPQIAWGQVNSSGDFIPLGVLGDISLIIGKAKSRKSFFINIITSVVLGEDLLLNRYKGTLPPDQRTVLYFDTEQSKYYVQLVVKRICDQINQPKPENLHVYSLRKFKPAERLVLVKYAIENTPNLGFVVIDGIRDLVTSINDEAQATAIASELMKWSQERNIHINCVLHQNKGDTNARGHLGTELTNKSETVLSVTKDSEDKKISIVSADYCRNKEPEEFAFEIINGLPVIAENYEFRTEKKNKKFDLIDLSDFDKYSIVNLVFSKDKQFHYTHLHTQFKLAFKEKYSKNIGDNRIKEFITDCTNEGWLIQAGARKPYTKGDFKPYEDINEEI